MVNNTTMLCKIDTHTTMKIVQESQLTKTSVPSATEYSTYVRQLNSSYESMTVRLNIKH